MRPSLLILGACLVTCALLAAWLARGGGAPLEAPRPAAPGSELSRSQAAAASPEARPQGERALPDAPAAAQGEARRAAAPEPGAGPESQVQAEDSGGEGALVLRVVDGLGGAPLEGARVRWSSRPEQGRVGTRLGGLSEGALKQFIDSLDGEAISDALGRVDITRRSRGAAREALVDHEQRSRLVSLSGALEGEPLTVRLFPPRDLRIEVLDGAGRPVPGVHVGVRLGPLPSEGGIWLWNGRTSRADGVLRIERADEYFERYFESLESGQGALAGSPLVVDLYAHPDPDLAVAIQPFGVAFPPVRLVLPAEGSLRVRLVAAGGGPSQLHGQVTLRDAPLEPGSRFEALGTRPSLALEDGEVTFTGVPLDREVRLELNLTASGRSLHHVMGGPTREASRVEWVASEPAPNPAVRVRVLDADGAALRERWVAVRQDQRPHPSSLLTDDGGLLRVALRGELEPGRECVLGFELPAGPGRPALSAVLRFAVPPDPLELDLGSVRLVRP